MLSLVTRRERSAPRARPGNSALTVCPAEHPREVDCDWAAEHETPPSRPVAEDALCAAAQAANPHPRLAELAEQIRRLRTRGPRPLPPCPSGLAALDSALGGGFARGAIHELQTTRGSAAARSVALLTAARAVQQQGWILYFDTTQDFYPPGAAQLGVPLERLVVIRAPRPPDALWAGEQSLRCKSVAAVVLPLRSLDAYASRRLQLAAETGGNLGLFILSDGGGGPTFAASRLHLDPRVGNPPVGAARNRRLLVSVLKLRAARPPEPFVLELPDGVGLTPPPTSAAHRSQRRRTGSAS